MTIKDTHRKLCDEFSIMNVSVCTTDATEGDYMWPITVTWGREGRLKSVKAMTVKLKDWYGTLEKQIIVSALGNGYLLDLELVGLGVAAIRQRRHAWGSRRLNVPRCSTTPSSFLRAWLGMSSVSRGR